MKKQTFFEILIEDLTNDLKSDPFFDDFKYRKKDASFIAKFKWGWKKIYLERWYDMLGRMYVRPYYEIRFNVLHKWFIQFSHKSPTDLRNEPSIYYDGRDLGDNDIYEFERNPAIYIYEYERFKNILIKNAKIIFNRINTVSDYYDIRVRPVLEKEEKIIAPPRIFEYLPATKIVAPQNYPKIKEIIQEWIKKWVEADEPNIVRYYPRMDEIFDYLENHDLKE